MPEFDPTIDYYEVLQVHPRAHREVIKHAYRTIMATLQAHPDLGGSHETAVRINQAYTVLSNEESRKAYDDARQLGAGMSRSTAYPPRASSFARAQPPPVRPGFTTRPAEHTLVYCPHCGTRNRLRRGSDLRATVCGKCGEPLQRADPALLSGDARHREIRLQRRMERELARHGEIRLHPVRVPHGKQLHCLRCRHAWPAPSGGGLPERCPHCRSRLWSDFRLFRCRFCRERFNSSALIVTPHTGIACWPWPYWVYPACPACGKSHWHLDCEQHPLRGLLNLFNGLLPEGW